MSCSSSTPPPPGLQSSTLRPFPPLPPSVPPSGEIPGLFTSEELAKELMPLDQRRNDDPTYTGPPNTYSYFVRQVQLNLHIVVSMDPSNDLFRPR
jgi:dynein heavy chain 2